MAAPKVKLPTSPTSIVVTVTLSCILALGLWTAYVYFLAPLPEIPGAIQQEQYYSQDLKRIATELQEYDTYQISVEDTVNLGRDDPFENF